MDPADCALAALPSFIKLSLTHCGSGSAAAALVIAAAAPRLRSLSLLNVALVDLHTAAPGVGIAGLLPAFARPSAAGAAGAAVAPANNGANPLSGLDELVIGYDQGYRTQFHMPAEAGCGRPDGVETVAAVVRALAVHRCCPRLRSLTVALVRLTGSATPQSLHTSWSALPWGAFNAAHPWPQLQALSLTCTDASAAVALAGLAAPKLRSLVVLPNIKPGGLIRKPWGANDTNRLSPALSAAYEAVRGRSPGLPPLREETDAAAAVVSGAVGGEGGEEEEGAAGGSGSGGAAAAAAVGQDDD